MTRKKKDWKPVSIEALRQLGRKLDIKFLSAKKMEGRGGLYERMNRLDPYPSRKWTTIHGPVWVGDLILMVLIKPRDDGAAYNNKVYPGECTNGWEKKPK